MSPQVSLLQIALLVAALSLFPIVAHGEEATFSHDDLATVLQSVVDGQGLVDYMALAADRATLDRYLEKVREVSPKNRPELFPTKDHELSYYINAYNALVLGMVLEKGPDRETVWGVTGTGYSFFVRQKVELGGQSTNLKALEDDTIRAEFEDPRIHAAINCASISCPRLSQKPFLPETLSAQLEEAIQGFVTEERHVHQHDGTVYLSRIFDWFAEDFLAFEKEKGAESPSVVGYINRHRPAGQKLDIKAAVSILEYDKRLNRQR